MIVPDLEVALLLVEEDVVQAPGDEGVEDQEVLHLGAEDLEAVRQEVVADLKVHRLNVGNAPQLLSQRRLTLICWAEMLQRNIFKRYFHALELSEML